MRLNDSLPSGYYQYLQDGKNNNTYLTAALRWCYTNLSLHFTTPDVNHLTLLSNRLILELKLT